MIALLSIAVESSYISEFSEKVDSVFADISDAKSWGDVVKTIAKAFRTSAVGYNNRAVVNDIVTFDFANEGTKDNADFTGFAHDVAMQVAAAAPVAAKREDVPADVIEHEKSIYMAQAAESGKPEAIQERMATGKLEKFFKENVLTEQESIKESGSTINELAAKVSKAAGDDVKVVSFVRYSFGE